MSEGIYIIAGVTLFSTFLIILNEWVKRYFDKKHDEEKSALWKEIYITGANGKIFSEPSDLLYELLKDGIVELEFSTDYERSIIRAFAKGLKPES
jgi:hypothetical protein